MFGNTEPDYRLYINMNDRTFSCYVRQLIWILKINFDLLIARFFKQYFNFPAMLRSIFTQLPRAHFSFVFRYWFYASQWHLKSLPSKTDEEVLIIQNRRSSSACGRAVTPSGAVYAVVAGGVADERGGFTAHTEVFDAKERKWSDGPELPNGEK